MTSVHRLAPLALVLLGALAAARAEQTPPATVAQALQLSFQAGEKLAYHEVLRGRGELVRHTKEGDQKLDVDFSAEGERAWQVDLTDEGAYAVQARCREGHAELHLPQASFTDDRPWRSFLLDVSRGGAVLRATVLTNEDDQPADRKGDRDHPQGTPEAPEEQEQGLPIDLDLGEVFTMAQLGLLPPQGVWVGDTWSTPRQPGSPFTVDGRFLELRQDQGAVAVLETKFSTPVPERGTPDPDVVVQGSVEGALKVFFDVAAGRVRSAAGPLVLKLSFKRRGSGGDPVGDLTLRLELETRRVEPERRR